MVSSSGTNVTPDTASLEVQRGTIAEPKPAATRLMIISNLGDARIHSSLLKQFHRQIVAMWARSAVENDERLVAEVFYRDVFADSQRVSRRQGNNCRFMEQGADRQISAQAITWPNEDDIQTAGDQFRDETD